MLKMITMRSRVLDLVLELRGIAREALLHTFVNALPELSSSDQEWAPLLSKSAKSVKVLAFLKKIHIILINL